MRISFVYSFMLVRNCVLSNTICSPVFTTCFWSTINCILAFSTVPVIRKQSIFSWSFLVPKVGVHLRVSDYIECTYCTCFKKTTILFLLSVFCSSFVFVHRWPSSIQFYWGSVYQLMSSGRTLMFYTNFRKKNFQRFSERGLTGILLGACHQKLLSHTLP